MDDLFMILGFLFLFVELPASIITTIVFAVKKKKIKVPAICIPASLVLSLVFLVSGANIYSQTDEYKELAEQQRIEREQEEEKERIAKEAEEELIAQEEAERKAEEEQITQEESEKKTEVEKTEEEEKRIEEKKEREKKGEGRKKKKFSYDKMDVEFIECKIEDNAWGEKCFVVYFDFTNNSEENKTFMYSFSVKAFQNGVEMESSLGHVNDETKNHGKEIQPGATIRVADAFYIEDEKSAIEIEVEPWISFSDKKLFEMKIDLTE